MSRRFLFAVGLTVLSPLAGNSATLFVDGSAPDTNSACTRAAPCSSFYYAMIAAGAGDTVLCVTPPKLKNFSIEKPITIDCSGARASVRDGGNSYSPVYIDLPSSTGASNTVRIRGFNVDATGLGYGITIVSAYAVYIEDCVVSNAGSQGIVDRRTGGQTRLYVKDSVVSSNAGPGIVATAQSPAVTVLDNVSLLNNTYGLAVAAGNNVVVTRSTISGNTTAGVHADGGAKVNVSNSALSHNTAHLNAYGMIRLKENELQFSNVAVQGAGARSAGANRFLGNVTLGSTPLLLSGAPADVYD